MKLLVIVFKSLVRLVAAVARRRRRPASTHLSDTDPDRFKNLLRRDFLRGCCPGSGGVNACSHAPTGWLTLLVVGATFPAGGGPPMFKWLAFEPVAYKEAGDWDTEWFLAGQLPAGWVWLVEPTIGGVDDGPKA